MYENLLKLIQQAETADRIGKIENVVGMSMEASGGRSGIGDIVMIYNEAENCQVPAEVVGFKNGKIQLMTYEKYQRDHSGKFCPQYRKTALTAGGRVSARPHYQRAGTAAGREGNL